MVIRTISLDHEGGYYFYRLHDLKLDNLCKNFSSLKSYLNKMVKDCPNSYFNSGPRSSALRFKLSDLKLIQVRGHEISNLARYSLENNENYNNGHSKVQTFMLEFDDKTIATEVPIYLTQNELDSYKELFKSDEPLTGHVDILRINDGKIWIWDFKPNAIREKYAATQVYFYALMLSKRTNIDLENFRCGYFDDDYAFVFKPELKMINRKTLFDFFK